MKHIIEGFSILLMLLLNLAVCVSVLGVSSKVAAAKEYKAAIVAEVENSNFNPNVIGGCIEDAKGHGYTLEIETCRFGDGANRQMAEICLTYKYEIPLLGLSRQSVTRGIAR